MNNVMLVGHLGQDPEIKVLNNDTKVANFSLATSRRFKNGEGEWETKTEWHRCFSFRAAGVIEKHCRKGDKIAVLGSIEYRSYENKEGQKVTLSEISVMSVDLFTYRNDDENIQDQPSERI